MGGPVTTHGVLVQGKVRGDLIEVFIALWFPTGNLLFVPRFLFSRSSEDEATGFFGGLLTTL
jgi:hypothetical protein|tara:strand:- start:954 stop:1139 length:186 start_codon:yes stop_codon:yes gene_type:complete